MAQPRVAPPSTILTPKKSAPPMAMSAYYLKGVLKKQIELMEIFRGLMPYLGIVILTMVLIYIYPGIALWLPDYFFGKLPG